MLLQQPYSLCLNKKSQHNNDTFKPKSTTKPLSVWQNASMGQHIYQGSYISMFVCSISDYVFIFPNQATTADPMAEPQWPLNLEWTSNDGRLHITRAKYYGVCTFRFKKGGNSITGIEGNVPSTYKYKFRFFNYGGRWEAYTNCPDREFDVQLVVHTHSYATTYQYRIPSKRKSCLKRMIKAKETIIWKLCSLPRLINHSMTVLFVVYIFGSPYISTSKTVIRSYNGRVACPTIGFHRIQRH